MESDESRPASSASNSSSLSSGNSEQSSPMPANAEVGPTTRDDDSEHSGYNSRPQSPRSPQSSNASSHSNFKAKYETDSSSSSLSSDEENDNRLKTRNTEIHRSNSESSQNKRQQSVSRSNIASPEQRSRVSSCSSNRSYGNVPENHAIEAGINISHEDLSDVSDMESEKPAVSLNDSKQSDDEGTNASSVAGAIMEDESVASRPNRQCSPEGNSNGVAIVTDLRQKLDQKKNNQKPSEISKSASNGNTSVRQSLEDLVQAHDEDALDFEAEEGECPDVGKNEERNSFGKNVDNENDKKASSKAEKGEELEEGEVSDEDEKRPEETEPKPVCRFYTRGQCTWGMSCRFLHPGVTDKGNYTMFDLVRPVPVSQTNAGGSRPSGYMAAASDYHDFRTERPPLHHRSAPHHSSSLYSAHHDARALISDGPVAVESAWERGLRTAKEMMRKANKRKEQDMDFEDKKMNLTLSPDELEKEPYYLKERAVSPVLPPYGRHGVYQEPSSAVYPPIDRFGRAPIVPPYDEVDPYGRSTRYRELPPHRMPHYEDERRVRPAREVILQRVEPVGRGDEWNDPWMRSKSPGGRASSRDHGDKLRRDRRSYSSNSSYSNSSSSQSNSSSNSTRSPSPANLKRRYNNSAHKSSPMSRRHGMRAARSPTPPTHHPSRHSSNIRHSPIGKRRALIIQSPIPRKRGSYSPSHKRKKMSPVSKKTVDKFKVKRRHTSSSSETGSSDSSGSESDSNTGSSSSESSSMSRNRTPKRPRVAEKHIPERKVIKNAEPPKKRSPISIEIKKQATVGASALTSPTNSISSERDSKKSRREELLKQLRAVEDAIAKKRSKLA